MIHCKLQKYQVNQVSRKTNANYHVMTGKISSLFSYWPIEQFNSHVITHIKRLYILLLIMMAICAYYVTTIKQLDTTICHHIILISSRIVFPFCFLRMKNI